MTINIERLVALATIGGKAFMDSMRGVPKDEVGAFEWVNNISTILLIVADTELCRLDTNEDALLLLYLSSANATQLVNRTDGEYKQVFETVMGDVDRIARDIVLKNGLQRASNIKALARAISDVVWQSPRDSGNMLAAINQAVESKKELFE